MPDIDFDELDRAVHDLMRQSGQLPTTPDKPSEAPATTPSKDLASSSTQTAAPQQTIAADSARPEESDDTQDASTPRAQDDNTSTDSAQQVDSSDDVASAKQSPASVPQDNTNSTDETVQTDDSTTVTDATSDTNTDSMPVRRRGVTIMPLSQQADEAEPAGESYEPVEPEPAVDRARALSESVVASEREPASMPANLEQTDAVDDVESTQATSVDTATPMHMTTDDMPSQSQPAAVVTVDPDDIITPASDDDDEDDDAYTDRAQFFGRSAARPFVASPAREATPVDDVASTTDSDTPASAAETDNVASSISSDNVASEETSAAATEKETPATIEQIESETPTMPYQFAGEDTEGDDEDEALVRHLNEVNQAQDDETEPAQTSVVDDLDDAFAPQPLVIPPPTEEESDTSLPSAEVVVEPADDAYTANNVPVVAPQDEPDNTTSVSDTDEANDDQLLYAPETSASTDMPVALSGDDTSDSEVVQPLDQPAWPELQYDESGNIPGVQASDTDHATPVWSEAATDSTSVADDSQTAAQVADADMLSEHVSFGDEGMPWQDELAASSTQSHVDDVAPAELLTAERAIPDAVVANDNPSPQPEEARTEDAMPEAHIDRPLPLLSTYNEHRATPEPHFDALPLSDSHEEANAIDVADVDQNTNDTGQSTAAMQLSDTPDSQSEQLYAPATPLFAPADDVVAKAQQIIAARPETSTNDAPTPPQEEEDTPKNAPDVVPITLSQSVDQQTEPSVADLPAMHTADETASAEQNDDQAAAPSIQRPRGRFMDIVGGAAPVAAAAQAARPRVRRQGAVVEPLTSSAPVVGMDIRPAPGHEPAQHYAGAASSPSASDEAKASDVVTPDGTPSADALDLQPGDEKPLSYTPFLPDAETKVDKRPLGGADTLVGDVPTLADTTPMGMYHDESSAFGIAPADNNEPSIPQHLFAPHDEHASAEQFIDALTDTSENAPSLYPTDDHYPLPEQDTPETATADDEPTYQLEDHYGADQSLYPDEQADSRAVSADEIGPQFAEDEIDLSLPVPGPGEPDIDYYGEAERVEAEPMTVAADEWNDESEVDDQTHVNTIEEAAATTQNGDTALALHQALQEENEGNVVAPIYSAEEFTHAPKKSRRRPEQAAGWIWLLWIVMLLALGAGLGAVYYTLFT
mgnify:FL=1